MWRPAGKCPGEIHCRSGNLGTVMSSTMHAAEANHQRLFACLLVGKVTLCRIVSGNTTVEELGREGVKNVSLR